jgi:MOSC domain-containing protein YiiM
MANDVRVVSVNVSSLRSATVSGRTVQTGIFKKPAAGDVRVHSLGLEGDEQGDKRAHGGVHMALYAYTVENYDYWRRELGRPAMAFGTLGENLTIEGLDESTVCIGDRFRVGGEVEVEVSVPRAPCATLAMVMGDAEFPKRFLASLRLGFYLRVVREGRVRAGDGIERVHSDAARLSIAEVARLMFFDKENKAAIARAAEVEALSPKWRDRFRGMLAEAPAGAAGGEQGTAAR